MAKKQKKILSATKMKIAEDAMNTPQFNSELDAAAAIDEILGNNLENENDVSPISVNSNCNEYYEQQLNESNERFFKVSEKLHELEEENSRLVLENDQLKNQILELENKISKQENEIFEANIQISEKNDRIICLENEKKKIKNNPSTYNIHKMANVGRPTLNGYESWN